jgi:hypothetical protein
VDIHLVAEVGLDVDAYGVETSVFSVGILRNQNGNRHTASVRGFAP